MVMVEGSVPESASRRLASRKLMAVEVCGDLADASRTTSTCNLQLFVPLQLRTRDCCAAEVGPSWCRRIYVT